MNLNAVITGKMFVPHVSGYITNTTLEETPTLVDISFNTGYTFSVGDKHRVKLSAGIKNIFNQYQDDFDKTIDRDPNYIYGPTQPITYFVGLKFGTGL